MNEGIIYAPTANKIRKVRNFWTDCRTVKFAVMIFNTPQTAYDLSFAVANDQNALLSNNQRVKYQHSMCCQQVHTCIAQPQYRLSKKLVTTQQQR